MDNDQALEAISAFRKAHDQNPEHYYLANFIQHLEFITSPEYESSKSVFDSYVGNYFDLKFHMEDGRLYYTDHRGLIFQLLPLAEDSFMVPGIYNLQIKIVHENSFVTGLKRVYQNGYEELFLRSNCRP